MSGRSKGAAAASSSSASAKKTRAEILGSAHSSSAAGGRKRKKRYEGTAFDGGFNQDEEDEDRAHPVFTEPVNMHDNMNDYMNVGALGATTNASDGAAVPYFATDGEEGAEMSIENGLLSKKPLDRHSALAQTY